MSNPLPEYDRPPVEEVAIGVQFEPLASLGAAHIGSYWLKIRDRYPRSEEHPPLLPRMDQEGPQSALVQFGAGAIPLRLWFLNPPGNELLQVQRDRFLRNWRRLEGNESYPRFAYLLGKFAQEWSRFQDFLAEENAGEARVNQCELTYVNHLEPGQGWKDYADLAKVFTILREPAGLLAQPELQGWQSRYKLPEGKGRLYAEAQPSFRARDLKLITVFTLTARGAPRGSDAILSWFDLAHEWIVRGFDQLTDSAMHQFWGKK